MWLFPRLRVKQLLLSANEFGANQLILNFSFEGGNLLTQRGCFAFFFGEPNAQSVQASFR